MSTRTAWTWLVVAALVEIAWAAGIKYTQGWTRLWPSVTVLAATPGRLLCIGLILAGVVGLKLQTP